MDKTLPINRTPDEPMPSLVSDARGMPHVAWIKNGKVCYSFFNGVDWEYRGDSPAVDNATGISPRSLFVSTTGIPTLVYEVEGGLKLSYLNNLEWDTRTTDGMVYSSDVTFYSYTYFEAGGNRYVVTLSDIGGTPGSSSSSSLSFSFSSMSSSSLHSSIPTCTPKVLTIWLLNGTVWEVVVRYVIPEQEDVAVDLKAVVDRGQVFLFWNGQNAVESWIGYGVFDPATGIMTVTASGKVESSRTTGEINGFDAMPRNIE